MPILPEKCERCRSPIKPVWGNGRAALKCTSSTCEWEMSANEYAQRISQQEQPDDPDMEDDE